KAASQGRQVQRMVNQYGRARRAATNTKLLVALGIMLLLAAGFWGWRAWSHSTESNELVDPAMKFVLTCSSCGKETEFTYAKAKKAEKNAEGKYKCPQCGQFTAAWKQEAQQSADD